MQALHRSGRRAARVILFCLVSAGSSAIPAGADAQEAKSTPKGTLLRAARLLDVKAGKVVTDRGVWIEGDRIKEVGPIEELRRHAPKDVKDVDLGDATILPGLIDCHTHLLMNYSKQMGDDVSMLVTVAQLGTTRRVLLGVGILTALSGLIFGLLEQNAFRVGISGVATLLMFTALSATSRRR
ncbi:hypothetical protein ACYOEI_25470 [Singulisphaera rosea]